MLYPLEVCEERPLAAGNCAAEAVEAPTESGAPEAWDFLEVLSSHGDDHTGSDPTSSCLERASRGEIVDILDWLARFTRDHFERSIHNLRRIGAGRECILARMNEHAELRKCLASLCVAVTFESPAVAAAYTRLYCMALLLDAEIHAERQAANH